MANYYYHDRTEVKTHKIKTNCKTDKILVVFNCFHTILLYLDRSDIKIL